MAEYRLYFIDQQDHIRGAEDILAADDVAALRHAELHPDPRTKEVWRGAHQLGRFGGSASSAPTSPRPPSH